MKKFFITLLLFFMYVNQAYAGMIIQKFTGAGGGTFVYDTFTNPGAQVALTSHSPDTGSAWVQDTGSAAIITASGSTLTFGGSTATQWFRNTAAPDDASYTVSMDFNMGSATGTSVSVAVCAQFNPGTTGGYCCEVNANGTTTLQELNSDGTWASNLKSGTLSGYTQSTTYTMSITVVGGTSQECVFDGGNGLSDTDTTWSAAGYAGGKARYPANYTYIDNFTATN